MAPASGTISSPPESLRGGKYWDGVEALRCDGYAIPVWIPQKRSERSDGSTYDKTPLWALRKAVPLASFPTRTTFITRESDDGGTYQGFPGRESYDRTLDELEALGIEHGENAPAVLTPCRRAPRRGSKRSRRTTGKRSPRFPDPCSNRLSILLWKPVESFYLL